MSRVLAHAPLHARGVLQDDHVKVASEHVKKAPVYDGASYGKNFLAHVDNDEWRRRRFGYIFTVMPDYIKTYFHKMERHAHALCDRLASGVEGTFMYGGSSPDPVFNIHEMLADTAFAIAADSLFNMTDQEIRVWSRKIRWALASGDPADKAVTKTLADWADFTAGVPHARRGPLLEALFELKPDHPESFGGAGKAFADDLHILTLAMHDTTGATMMWCLTELARRPQLQARVAAEAREVLADIEAEAGSRAVTYDDLYKMPLLTKCINETLRLYPAVAYGSMRQLEHDTELHCGPGPDDTTVVPKGTNVMVQSFTNHRRVDLWGPDAAEWKPSRWQGFGDVGSYNFVDGDEDHTTTYSGRNPQSRRFHPFTRAPRDCFGKNFAQAEMRVVLPVLLSKFEFSLAEPTRSTVAGGGTDSMVYQLTGILKPRDGLWMSVKPRSEASTRELHAKL